MENDRQAQMKRFIGYLAYILVLGYLTSYGMSVPASLKLKASTNLDLINLSVFYFCFPIILGILFAVPRFIAAVKEEGKWQVDVVKCLAIGLPAFIWSVKNSLLVITTPHYLHDIPWMMPYPLSGIVLGFVLLDSLKKG